MAEKFRPNVQRTTQILPEELKRARLSHFRDRGGGKLKGQPGFFGVTTKDAFRL